MRRVQGIERPGATARVRKSFGVRGARRPGAGGLVTLPYLKVPAISGFCPFGSSREGPAIPAKVARYCRPCGAKQKTRRVKGIERRARVEEREDVPSLGRPGNAGLESARKYCEKEAMRGG
jgi:hypothetical protein